MTLRSSLGVSFAVLAVAACGAPAEPPVDAYRPDAATPQPDAFTIPTDAATVCMPEGVYTYMPARYVGVSTNPSGCASSISEAMIAIGPSGELLNGDGTAAACLDRCAPADCEVTRAEAPTCSGHLRLTGTCGRELDNTFTITGDRIDVRLVIGSAIIGDCVYTATGTRP